MDPNQGESPYKGTPRRVLNMDDVNSIGSHRSTPPPADTYLPSAQKEVVTPSSPKNKNPIEIKPGFASHPSQNNNTTMESVTPRRPSGF